MEGSPPKPERSPTLGSSAEGRIRGLKRDLVLQLFFQRGPFWDGVLSLRSAWGITARRGMPSKEDSGTYCPIDLALEKPAPYKATKALGTFFDRWDDALRPLRDRFVPDGLRRGPAWDEFLGACVMCDPPGDYLAEFAEFGTVHPTPQSVLANCGLRRGRDRPREY
jgi:hypothetical protein